ncbi:RDD family protein [Eikenella sp. S3360]|uniref:RDD family protein n=1 Tax=Eikenella glucosivorans TaxID=2766967 RepID=A0ABS0NB14_9NEIS|nr:RDD family protein [Eikenella glucosivorans]MBH5329511.1 RDD family protein [Eikenella glucosivorans]
MSETLSSRLDTLLKVETPEAIDIYLRPASVFARSRAWFVDFIIRMVWFTLSTMLLAFVFSSASGRNISEGVFFFLLFVNGFFTVWLYFVVFEVWWHGQTPGKKIFGLRVVNDNGTHITWSASLLRNLLRVFDGMPMFYGVGLVTSLCNPYGRRLGDILASTVVVYADKTRGQAQRMDLGGVQAVTPPVALTREEQQAILSFVERRRHLSAARTAELAQMMAGAIFGRDEDERSAERLILGLAKYYAGEQRRAAE